MESHKHVLVSSYSTIISHHNKNPQFYDEVKILLPLNLHEKHHLLFKFYHISCNNAKSVSLSANSSSEMTTNANANANEASKKRDSLTNASINSINLNLSPTTTAAATTLVTKNSIETLIGYAWMPLFKKGRVFNGEKILPIAQSLSNNYLAFEQIGLGQTIGPNDIKWVENMKSLFKVNCVSNSTVHTHVRLVYSFALTVS